MANFYPYNNLTLIKLVEERPCLWDKSLELYRQRIPKKAAWNEIFNLFNPDYEILPKGKKKEYGDAIISRWIHIRDAFSRSLKTMTPTKKYIYYDHMQFMLKNEEYMYDESFIGSLEMKIDDRNYSIDYRPPIIVKFPYDIYALIEGVEKNPCLWDKESEDFHDEMAKEAAWHSIAQQVESVYDSLDEEKKKEIIVVIKMKWSSIKDAYFRVLKSGNKKYIYHDQMCFLTKDLSPDEYHMLDEPDPIAIGDNNTNCRPQKRKHYFLEDDILDRMDALISERDDEDFGFFTSLMPTMKKMTTEEKLEFRADVVASARKILDRKTTESYCEAVLEENRSDNNLKLENL